MLTREERIFKERQYGAAFEQKIKDLNAEYPHHNYEALSELARMLYPKLFEASMGEFSDDDDFDARQYTESEQPEYETAADELAHRAKIYSLRKQVPYEQAAGIIMETDPELAEAYKMS